MGIMHLVRTQAACIYLFHFHKLILCGFNQIFLNHKRIFFNHNQSISTTNNSNQPFAINQFSHQSQPINIVHGLWTRGYIYIAIHFYFNTYIIFTTHIYNLYIEHTTYTTLIQEVYNAYITHTSTI